MDPNFDLLFDSEEEGQSYIDDYKTHVVGSGDKNHRRTHGFLARAAVFDRHHRPGYRLRQSHRRRPRRKDCQPFTLNRATDTLRQPGSTFKILSTYAPALSSGEKL